MLVVGVTFSVATMATGVREGVTRRSLPNRFAHSVVPIVVGYVVAHYLSYFVEVGQQTVVQLSDPLGPGPGPARHLRPPGQLLALHAPDVPGGAEGAVRRDRPRARASIAAHDRAIKLLPRRHQLTGQLPLLLVMVFYTVTGLYLLFGA